MVAAVRIVPVLSSDPWTLSEVLLHPATAAAARGGWDEWLDPHLTWKERARALGWVSSTVDPGDEPPPEVEIPPL